MKSEIIETLRAPQTQIATVTLIYQIVMGCLRRIGKWIKVNWEHGDRIHREVESRKEEVLQQQIRNGNFPRMF
jgi:hypothetical protein